MNIIMVTTGRRPKLLWQSLESLCANARNRDAHRVILVLDHAAENRLDTETEAFQKTVGTYIQVHGHAGASRCRNIGASSIPKYLRQSHVMFLDDDVYMCPEWDVRLEDERGIQGIISGHAHPFNRTVFAEYPTVLFTNVISTVHMTMPWSLWDAVGFFTEPGGPGGSEDVDYCKRTLSFGTLAITKPMCVIHTGLTSSSGKPIVGAELVIERNKEIEKFYGIEGRVQYG